MIFPESRKILFTVLCYNLKDSWHFAANKQSNKEHSFSSPSHVTVQVPDTVCRNPNGRGLFYPGHTDLIMLTNKLKWEDKS